MAIGLVLEGVEIFHDVIAWCKRKRRKNRELANLKEVAEIFPSDEAKGETESHSDHPRWVKRVLRVGLIAVVIGVVGEWRYGAKLEDAHNVIHEYDVAKLTAVEKEAANAEATAKGFDAKIAESTARVKAAEAVISTADARIAEAQRDAAESKKEAESERLARVKLQKELEPRRLTGVQKEKLRSLLSADPQQIMFGWCMTGSDDCQDFVNDIGEAFNKAGWKTWFGASAQNKRGLRVGFMKGSDDKLAAHFVPKIRNALAEVGLSSEQAWFDPNDRTLVGGFEKNVLYLIVGQKPAIKTDELPKD